jgi:tryptophanase
VSERRHALASGAFDLFRIPSDLVAIDLLTDSGTGAMSSAQWAAMMRGDESYAGSASYLRLVEVLSRITGIAHVLPVHQGRVAERLLVDTIIGRPGNPYAGGGNGLIVPNNAHFDTTRHMIESSGAEAHNLLAPGGNDPENAAAFKGDMDLAALERLLKSRGDDVPFIMLTLTCNSNGGQPVSLANMQAVRDLCDRFSKPLILDACRFAENAWFIRQLEAGQSERSVLSIAREMFDLSDGVAMSTRKDGLCNVGGLLLLRDEALHRRACSLCVLTQGFTMTYGSLPARDLEAMAIGLQEVMDESYLANRAAMIANLAQRLEEGRVTTVRPPGGHAVFLDAEDFCPHLMRERGGAVPPAAGAIGHALACAIFEHTGVRCAPIGSVLVSPRTGKPLEMVRLAIPRRTHTQAQLDFVAASIVELKRSAASIALRAAARPITPSVADAALEPAWH